MTLRTTRTASAPLGHLADGTAFWAYFGSAGPDDGGNADGGPDDGGEGGEDDDSDGNDEDDDDKIGEDGLTGRGRRAIESERQSARRARDKVKPWNALQRELGMTPDQIRAALAGKTGTKSDAGKDDDKALDADAIRRQAREEVMQEANSRLVQAGVATVAADMLNDPDDAARYLDLSDYEVDDKGKVDRRQIRADLTALLREKPYLGKSKRGDGRDGGQPDFDGGSRKTTRGSGMNELIRETAFGRNRR